MNTEKQVTESSTSAGRDQKRENGRVNVDHNTQCTNKNVEHAVTVKGTSTGKTKRKQKKKPQTKPYYHGVSRTPR